MALSQRNKRLLIQLGPGHPMDWWVLIDTVGTMRLERQILNGAPTQNVRLVGPDRVIHKAPRALQSFNSPDLSATVAAWAAIGPHYQRRIVQRVGFCGFWALLVV